MKGHFEKREDHHTKDTSGFIEKLWIFKGINNSPTGREISAINNEHI